MKFYDTKQLNKPHVTEYYSQEVIWIRKRAILFWCFPIQEKKLFKFMFNIINFDHGLTHFINIWSKYLSDFQICKVLRCYHDLFELFLNFFSYTQWRLYRHMELINAQVYKQIVTNLFEIDTQLRVVVFNKVWRLKKKRCLDEES